jgi:hypothetical protein
MTVRVRVLLVHCVFNKAVSTIISDSKFKLHVNPHMLTAPAAHCRCG